MLGNDALASDTGVTLSSLPQLAHRVNYSCFIRYLDGFRAGVVCLQGSEASQRFSSCLGLADAWSDELSADRGKDRT